ncbi:class I adenylate-forming enzyme family protein [Streptomyces glaucosporus]
MSSLAEHTARPTGAPIRPDAYARRAAEVLHGLGVRPEHRVALHAGNSAEYVWALLGLMRLGAGVVLLDHLRSARSAQEAAARVRADRLLRADVSPGDPAGPVPVLSLAEVADRVYERDPAPPAAPLPLDAWEAREDALIAWSSGSTGEPKAIVRSGRSVLENTRRTVARMGYRDSDVLAPLLPFSHQYGFSLVLIAQVTGCGLLTAPYTRLDRALEAVGAYAATVVDATPSAFRSLLRLLERRPALADGLRGVRMWCTGGAPLDDRLARDFRAAVGLPLLDGYGSTELGNVALAGPGAPGDCLPLDGVEVSVRDEAGRALPPGRPGEVWVRTPDVMRGLLGPDGTLSEPAAPGEFRTRDLGVLDARGGLRVLGRMSATTRHGYTLYPAHLARKAERCGRPVHVVPVRDVRGGSRLVFLVEDPRQRPASTWFAEFGKVLEPYEMPNLVLVLPGFPTNGNSKTDVPALEERARRALAKGVHQ